MPSNIEKVTIIFKIILYSKYKKHKDTCERILFGNCSLLCMNLRSYGVSFAKFISSNKELKLNNSI